MPFLHLHPAPGLGELMPGWFVVPQNPIAPDYTALVPTPQAKAHGQPVRVRGMRELLSARFTVPQNPIRRELSGNGVTGLGGCGCAGGGCMGNCGCPSAIGFSGLGQTTDTTGATGSLMDTLTTGYTPYVIGGALLFMFFMSGRGRSYREDVAKVRQRHPSRYQRVKRAVESY